jgi:hypothetical protein
MNEKMKATSPLVIQTTSSMFPEIKDVFTTLYCLQDASFIMSLDVTADTSFLCDEGGALPERDKRDNL